MNWAVYNELAWTEHILSPPEDYRDEAGAYLRLIEQHAHVPGRTMLHLGCGAGGHDFHFKQRYAVTGVDISEGMLELAKKTNPEIEYIPGDMRTVDLRRRFDAVVIPDSVMYMRTLADLRLTVRNAARHLADDGVLLIVCHTKEDFHENNFAYTGERDGIHITVLENNHITGGNEYEAAIIYLIRRGGVLDIRHEVHTLGLFEYGDWLGIFAESGLEAREADMDHLYKPYLLGEGSYPLKVFICTRTAAE